MDDAAQGRVDEIITKDAWTADDHEQLLQDLFAIHDAPNKFKAILQKMESEAPEATGATALKIGIARYMLCRPGQALEVLAEATDNKDRRFFQALCCKVLRQYDRAAEEFERARSRGWDETEIEMQLIEVQALSGQLDQAEKALGKLSKKQLAQTARYQYLLGLICELTGRADEAVAAYTESRRIDPACVPATFRLAYYLDLHGDEAEAIELYTECLSHPPLYANALLNLAVLYDDAGRYDKAVACLRRILSANPSHARARLFLRDVQSSKTMYYDEDQAKRIARRNALLDTPVTDFELSVRARNCLKKMNIRALGDLVRTTEAGLLSYKNFGETSLKEIKDMLSLKGLRLGQALEEGSELADATPAPAVSVQNEGVLGTPLDQLDLSIRVRGAVEALRLRTLGDLVAKTEAELLACKNFGQTSLNEVRSRLREYGLHLPDSA